MNNETFLVEDSELDLAKDICKLIEDSEVRNRAVANVLAANIAKKYFQDFDVDIDSGIHNVASVLNEYEISDIYVKDSYVDVRLYFDENEMYVPASHFEFGVLPVAYMFIKLDEELSGGTVTGFVLPNAIETKDSISGYYKVSESDLISFYDVEPLLCSSEEDNLVDSFDKDVFDYLDGNLQDKVNFYKILISSKEARQKLYNVSKAKDIFNFVSITKEFSNKEENAVLLDESVLESSELLLTESNEDNSLESEMLESLESNEDSNEFDDTLVVEDLSLEEDNQVDSLEEIDYEVELLNGDLVEDIENVLDENTVALETIFPEATLGINDGLMFESLVMSETGFESEETIADEIVDLNQDASQDYLEDNLVSLDEIVLETENEAEISLSNEDFSTNVTPSIDSIVAEEPIEDALEVEGDNGEFLEVEESFEDSIDENEESVVEIEVIGDNRESIEVLVDDENEEVIQDEEQQIESDNSEMEEVSSIDEDSLEELFANTSEDSSDNSQTVAVRKKKPSIVTALGLVTLLAVAGYFGYTKYSTPISTTEPIQKVSNTTVKESVKEDAMPIETIEEVPASSQVNETPAPAIKSIERSLGSSVKVTNMTINWSIPLSYESSNTARRYLTKIGEILQLQLKTELLLLTQGPINNKVAVELAFNKDLNKFDVKSVTTSSGDTTIDDVIKSTVKKVLDMNLGGNLSTLGSMQGNPVLVINF